MTLTGVDLNAADLSGANLSGTDMDDAILTGVNLGGTNLAGASLAGEQSEQVTGTPAALPTGWSITGGFLIGPGADLRGASLVGLKLNGSDLSGADLSGADLLGVSLASANLTSADLSGADAGKTNLTGATLDQADLDGGNLQSSNLTDAKLTGANLTNAVLQDSTLTGASLAGTTLTGASGVSIKGTPASLPAHWSLVGGYLIGPGAGTYLTDADLNSRNLTGVDFSGLTLLRTTFEHANLTRANLTKANLTGADFTSANLTKADLDGATVSSTNFTGAVWSDTICPNGSNSNTLAHGRCFAPPPVSPFTAAKLPTPAGRPPRQRLHPAGYLVPHGHAVLGGRDLRRSRVRGQPGRGAALDREGMVRDQGTAAIGRRERLAGVVERDQHVVPFSQQVPGLGGTYEPRTGSDAMLAELVGQEPDRVAGARARRNTSRESADAQVNGMACPSTTTCFAVGAYSATNQEYGSAPALVGRQVDRGHGTDPGGLAGASSSVPCRARPPPCAWPPEQYRLLELRRSR